MKKLLSILAIIIAVTTLAGCGSDSKDEKEIVSTFYRAAEGFSAEVTYYHKNDVVSKQVTKSVIEYSVIGVTDEEGAKEIIAIYEEKYEGVDGLTYEVIYEDDKLTENITIDFNVIDFKEFSEITEDQRTDIADADFISFKSSEELLLNSGWEKKSE